MSVNWSKDIDQTLAAAKGQFRPILLYFSAAPARGACARLDFQSYEDQKTAEFIGQNFLPWCKRKAKTDNLRICWSGIAEVRLAAD